MLPHTLMIAKMTWVLLVWEQFSHYLHEPFLPFFDSLYLLNQIPGYGLLLKLLFFGAGIALMLNRQVRTMSILLGLITLLANVQSEVNFRNHSTICGCALLLAGLTPPGKEPWLIRWQMVVVYLGAWLNKQLDPDWLDGSFFQYWTHAELKHSAYMYLAALLPGASLSILFSWTTILSEFAIMVGLAVRRWWCWALWMGALFHLATFVFMKGNPFGHFMQSLGIVYLAFITWPKARGTVRFGALINRIWIRMLRCWDSEKQYDWTVYPSDPWLSLTTEGKQLIGLRALREILLHSPGFFWTVFILFQLLIHLLPWPEKFFTTFLLLLLAATPFALASLSDFLKLRRARQEIG